MFARKRFLSGLCDRELVFNNTLGVLDFLSGLCDREPSVGIWLAGFVFLSGLCDREHEQKNYLPNF